MSGLSWPALVEALSGTLLALAWQLALLAGGVAAVLRLLRRQPAAARYAVLAVSLTTCLLLAVLEVSAVWPTEAMGETDGVLVLTEEAGTVQDAAGPAPLRATAVAGPTRDPGRWREMLVLGWLIGVAAMALRLLGGVAWLTRWQRQAGAAPAALQRRLDELAQRMGLRHPVVLRLLKDPQAAGPLTVGWWRPVVLMPAALLSGLPMPLLDALLAHELAHVRRWDYLANLLQRVVEAMLFFHPAVWWLSRRLRIERELVADDLATRVLASPRDLALALQVLAERPAQPDQPSLAAAAQGGELLTRIQALLRRPTVPGSPLPALVLAAVLTAVPLLMALGLSGASADSAARAVGASDARARNETDVGELAGAGSTPALAKGSVRREAPRSGLPLLAGLSLSSAQVLVSDADTGEVLFSRESDREVPVASLSKLMTALLVLQAGQALDEVLEVSRDELRGGANGGPSLRPGQHLTREAALMLMLQASDNRAALLLARYYPGGLAAFGQASDAMAARLGMTHTRLHHPSGASDSNLASAEDVARLLAAAAAQPLILRAIGSARLRIMVDGRERESRSTHPFMGDANWSILMAKTGTSRTAGRCVALQMLAGGRRLSVVLLGSPDATSREADLLSIRTALQT